jgi:hypothetical protein
MIIVALNHVAEEGAQFQSGGQLEEAGDEPAQGEMEETNMLEKVTEQ